MQGEEEVHHGLLPELTHELGNQLWNYQPFLFLQFPCYSYTQMTSNHGQFNY